MSYARPAHCSERFEGVPRYDECGPCSEIMLVRAHRAQALPPCSQAEANAIRIAGGGNISDPFTRSDQLAKALDVRYGIPSAHVQGAAAVWSKLIPGKGAIVAGKLSNFPWGHRLRRHQPTYAGGHFVYVARMDTQARVWWMDPLARTTERTRDGKTITYRGEWVTRAELATFQKLAIADAGVIASIAKVTQPVVLEEAMIYVSEQQKTMAAGTTIYQQPSTAAALVGTTATAAVVRTVGRPQRGGTFDTDWWGIRWTTAVPTGGTPTERVCWVPSSALT